MAADAKILLRIVDGEAGKRVLDAGLGGDVTGEWHEIAAADDEATARRLSKSLGVTAVWFSVHATLDLVEIKCFEHGKELRHLLHSPEDGWLARTGEPLPLPMTTLLERWLESPSPLAELHTYGVAGAVLGEPPLGDHASGSDTAVDEALA